MTDPNSSDQPYVGGQAVIEGVMMRSPRAMAVAVRRPDGTIVVREDAWVSIFERLKFLRWPLMRGSVVLVESLFNGIQALNFSAAHAMEDEDAPAHNKGERKKSEATASAADDAPAAAIEVAPRSTASTAGTIALSMLIAFGLFKGLPHFLTVVVDKLAGGGVDLGVDRFAFHALDGVFKLSIFVAYIAGISMIPEIRRVFEYHGAEHKAINVYEHGEELTVENARKWTTFHPRCGTSFILFVLVLSIFMFASIFPFVPQVFTNEYANHAAMIALKIPLMLPLAGLAYEINRYASRHPDQWWVQLLVIPGAMMQKITTREPDDDQLEIALAAMRSAVAAEARLAPIEASEAAQIRAAQPAGGHVTVFRDFGEVTAALQTAR